MTRLSVALGTICCLGFGAASAAELAPQSGYSIHLGGMDGTVYYTVQADGYRVVATVASADGSPIRFTSTIKAGQRMVISIPQAVDQAAIDFAILRDGDVLRVGEPLSAITADLAAEPAALGR
jgi:hypothetical protein